MASVPRALIFAAGLGTRLRPLTDSIPKALVQVGGKPLLWHVVMKLKAAGYREITVNVHHFPDQIIEYIASQQGGDFAGLEISVSDERDLLRDTGGGIKYAGRFLSTASTPFLVHNVDVLTNLSLEWLEGQARPEALATLVVSERQTSRYLLFDEDMRLVGWTNLATGEVKLTRGAQDVNQCRRLAFSGIHLVSPTIFRVFDELKTDERFSIIDFYLAACGAYPIYGVVPEDFRFMDIGKIAALPQAEEFIKSL